MRLQFFIILTAMAFFVSYATISMADLMDDLVAHYKLEQNVEDSAGNENHGTLNKVGGGASYIQGKVGDFALNFVGDSDHVHLGNFDPSAGSGAFTVAFWVKWNGKIANSQGLISKRTVWPSPWDWQIAYNNSADEIRFERDTVLGSGEPIVVEGEWVHLAFTFDGTTTAKIFGNGKEIAAMDGFRTGGQPDADIVLGVMQLNGSPEPLNGALDDVMFFKRALSAGEIEQIMAGIAVVESGGKAITTWGTLKK
ncbi:LamG domain-containing protein [Candidatus Poribacteria bacterium]